MKRITYFLLALVLTVLTSCSDKDYLNAIPAESTLLISMNTAKLSGAGNQMLLKTLLHVSNLDNTGLDLSSNLFFFEDAQGNLGLCAKMDDADKLGKTLSKAGLKTQQKRGFDFSVLPNHWIIGYSDKAALMMGPVVPAAEAETMSMMAKYLSADEEDGISGTPLYDKLDSISAPMAMVCQTQALPEQFIAPFTLGAPKDADASQVMIAAEMEVKKGCLWINGQTFSFNKRINAALVKAAEGYRPIEGRYVKSMSNTDAIGIFMNVDGTQFIQLMRQNRGLKAMLSGINAAIDMDNIIKSINGDMSIITPTMGGDHFNLMMAAKVKHANWLADVDYWKQSVPQGGYIGDWGRDCYYYTGDKTAYYFGVTKDWQYMSGGSKEAALQSVAPSKNPITPELQNKIKGEKLVMVVNFDALKGSKAEAVTSLLKPMFGNLNAIVYTLK
ncbi:MAG: DUF4836 family protein [Prevotella sp.]|nr:DUF4836 family protein [Prevotella sp.]